MCSRVIVLVLMLFFDMSAMQSNTPSKQETRSDSAITQKTKSHKKLSKKGSKDIKKECECLHGFQEIIGQSLLAAVTENSLLKTVSILSPNVNITGDDGKTPLVITIQKNNIYIAQELLGQKNVDVNKADIWGNTPLHHAALKRNSTIIKLLLYDHRVNAACKNIDNFFAHDFIVDWLCHNIEELRLLFFVRYQLDLLVDKEVLMLRTDCVNRINERIDLSTRAIKDCVVNECEKQKGDCTLSELVQSPINYDFIKKMITYRLTSLHVAQEI